MMIKTNKIENQLQTMPGDLGHTFLSHAPDSSFPSEHLTLLWGVGFSFLMHARLRAAGALLSLLGLPMAWVRIYLGIHFTLDRVGAALVATVSAYLCFSGERWFMAPMYQGVTRI